MTTTQQHEVTIHAYTVPENDLAGERYAIEDDINTVYRRAEEQGRIVKLQVNSGGGRRVYVPFRSMSPARAWGTGTLSVSTKASRGQGTHEIWFRPGDSFRIITSTRR